MFRKAKKESKTYGIIGMGRFGSALALELAKENADLIVLDRNEEKIREIREYTDSAYVVKSLDKKSLMETGIQNCEVVVVCIGEQLDVSILTTLNLVSLGVPTVISKARSQEHGEILTKLGAQVVYPERDIAIRLAHRLEAPRMLDYIQISEKLNIAKQLIPDSMVGLTVRQIGIRSKLGVNIIAIENDAGLQDMVIPDYAFKKGDILYVSGSEDGLEKLSEIE